jgi:2-dehydro-3-deoxy-D-arabinonate dehydratase
MRLCKVRTAEGQVKIGVAEGGQVRLFPEPPAGPLSLAEVLHAADPATLLQALLPLSPAVPEGQVKFLAPVDAQEVWAAGVTYTRSREARERESEGAGQFYDRVYNAERPELFLKATPRRVVGQGDPVRIRRDAKWSVPEPELALVVSPEMQIVGYTIGNDMSSRDIEGENPLYLPQAKVYEGSCSVGPVVTLPEAFPPREQAAIGLTITRRGVAVFDGSTTLAAMKRTFKDLVSWLGRENSFPDGVILLTGTGIVPPDDFTLAVGDNIVIEVTGIGRLENRVY